jgi:hypothetical protein
MSLAAGTVPVKRHMTIEDMHISFLIEDYREEPRRKISESVA